MHAIHLLSSSFLGFMKPRERRPKYDCPSIHLCLPSSRHSKRAETRTTKKKRKKKQRNPPPPVPEADNHTKCIATYEGTRSKSAIAERRASSSIPKFPLTPPPPPPLLPPLLPPLPPLSRLTLPPSAAASNVLETNRSHGGAHSWRVRACGRRRRGGGYSVHAWP